MPYTMKVEGLDEISQMLTDLNATAESVAAQGLYEGAGVMADELNRAVDSIKTEPFHYTVFGMRLPSPEEKEIVKNAAAGIAKFHREGGAEIDTSIGFQNSGYAELDGKMKPIPVIVNSINSGTSFMKKQPFIGKTARKAAPKASEKMKEVIESAWSKIYRETIGNIK